MYHDVANPCLEKQVISQLNLICVDVQRRHNPPLGLAANGLVKVGGAAARAHLCHLGNRLAGVVGWQCHAPVTQDLQACMHCEPSKLGLRTGQQPLPTWQKGRVGSASTQAAGRGVVVSKTFRVYTSLDKRQARHTESNHALPCNARPPSAGDTKALRNCFEH